MMKTQANISDATWLLLWQVWRSSEIMDDYYAVRDIVRRLLVLEMNADRQVFVKDTKQLHVPTLVCICGEFSAQVNLLTWQLSTGCLCCKQDSTMEVSKYISCIYHTLARDYGIYIPTEYMKAMLASALYLSLIHI